MILKVTKMLKNVYVDTLWCKWWWWMSLSLCPLSSVFFYFDISPHFSPPNGLERSQNGPWRFNPSYMSQMVLKAANSVHIHDGLERVNSPCQSQMVLKEVTYGCWFSLGPWPWPVAVFCRVLMVMFQLTGLKVHVRVLGQCHGIGWKLVQTGVSSYLQVRSPLNWAPWMLLWMGMMLGGEYDGNLGEWCLGGDDGGVWCVLGSSNNMDLVSI